jgi:hypothetical protein
MTSLAVKRIFPRIYFRESSVVMTSFERMFGFLGMFPRISENAEKITSLGQNFRERSEDHVSHSVMS